MKMIYLFTALFLSATAHAAKDEGSTLHDIHVLVGSEKFVEIERLYLGEGKYTTLVNTSLPDKKSRTIGGLAVKGDKEGDYFTAIEELCNPTTVMHTTRESSQNHISFHCFTK